MARSRHPLSRDRVVTAAVAVADEHGIEALSMRRLAKELGVEAMSLYHHVASKDDLLDAMVDLVIGEFTLPSAGEPWQTALRNRCTSARAVLSRHRWATALVDSRSKPGPATLEHYDAVIGCLRAAGFSLELTAHAMAVIDAFVYGFALQESSVPFDSQEEMLELVEHIAAQLPAQRYPHFAEMARDHVLQSRFDYRAEFDFGLDLVLDGLERSRAAATNVG